MKNRWQLIDIQGIPPFQPECPCMCGTVLGLPIVETENGYRFLSWEEAGWSMEELVNFRCERSKEFVQFMNNVK